ncbi:MAG: DNA mismatch repair protein MutS [Ruminococcaceae bacterium]|nr:DNA mismatch repair protein MutS [Oscillospiraceae bacterium]
MMRQYLETKENYKDHILFYRLGDFYEMFFDDAITTSRVLELTLTGKDCGMEERAPMCGIPYHAADQYIARLVKKGYKVAICEQTEDPATAKGLVKREVVRIITPGTVTEGSLLVDGKNNYLCAVYIDGLRAGIALCDISTADVYATDFADGNIDVKVLNELGIYTPSEVILNIPADNCETIRDFVNIRLGASLSSGEKARFKFDIAVLSNQFGEGFMHHTGISEDSAALPALCALLSYITETQKTDISFINKLNYYSNEQFLEIDINTRRNLELCETMRSKEKKGSLLWVLDKTKTAMGARLLRKWIEQPLVSRNLIERRQSAVSELFNDMITKDTLAERLSKVSDLERLMTKIVYNTANGRDLKSLENTAKQLPVIKTMLSAFSSTEMCDLYNSIDTLSDIEKTISEAVVDEPPFSVREGGIFRSGYNAAIDELRSMMGEGESWLVKIEQQEREATGIKNLKIGYNRVFGYYLEVTNSYKDLVPDRYIRKQTLTGAERYITEELKEMESRVLGAKDKVTALEYELFQKIREYIAENISRIRSTAAALSRLDVFASLADVAKKNNFVCPEVDYSDKIYIKDGRHPIVETFLPEGMFIPNDVELDNNSRLMLITGPNMAGKSTYMRQSALIVVMAQMGSFVPAREARIGIVDKLFTRVGASDDLASGQSTFMLEMTEVAYILKNATNKSFIIYDEIGRGTSTFDGMSIARAVAEYTAGKKLAAKTMFATHYHELCELEETCQGVINYNIAAKKRGDELIFLRKIIKGAADDSYGIEVAKLAGIPKEVTKRAQVILDSLNDGKNIPESKLSVKKKDNDDGFREISIDDLGKFEVADKLQKLDLNTLTPIEALTKLYELKNLL